MKKLLGILLALALLLGCTAALADPVTLTYAEVNPLDGTIVGEMAKAFKEKAEEVYSTECRACHRDQMGIQLWRPCFFDQHGNTKRTQIWIPSGSTASLFR